MSSGVKKQIPWGLDLCTLVLRSCHCLVWFEQFLSLSPGGSTKKFLGGQRGPELKSRCAPPRASARLGCAYLREWTGVVCPTQSFSGRNRTWWVCEAPGSEAGVWSCYLPGLGGVVWCSLPAELGHLTGEPAPHLACSTSPGKADLRLRKERA